MTNNHEWNADQAEGEKALREWERKKERWQRLGEVLDEVAGDVPLGTLIARLVEVQGYLRHGEKEKL